MRRLLACIALILTLVVARDAEAARPHIVMVVADDLGYADAGTPHLARLAAEGVRLTAHYSHPTCSPTRAALMTGRYGFRVGVPRVSTRGRRGGDLRLGVTTLAEMLGAAGYETACVGKWRLGRSPLDHGFEHYYGFPDIPAPAHFRPDGYSSNLLGDQALRQIAQRDPERPLFLYLAFNAPHVPLQAPVEYLNRFPDLRGERRTYAAMIAALDDQVGRVRAALATAGMLDNTVIIFQSDNGGDLRHGADNTPLAGSKGTPSEGGVRVAATAWRPSRWAPSASNRLTHAVDWLPTLAVLAGATPPANLDGRDLGPLLANGTPIHDEGLLVAHEPQRFTVYREGRFKLVMRGRREQLFDMNENERKNVASEHPSVLRELRAKAIAATIRRQDADD